MSKKLLILTGSYGGGHNAATKAIKNTIEKKYTNYEVHTLDISDFFSQIIGNITKSYYEDFCAKYPKFWEKTFDIFDDSAVKRFLYAFRSPLFHTKFDEKINNLNPNAILVVFPFWQSFIKHYLKKHNHSMNIGTMITDAYIIHSLWYLKKDFIDEYFVIDKYSKEEFKRKFKHSKENVTVSFFPIEEKLFYEKKQINNKNITILLNSLDKKFTNELLEKINNNDNFNISILKGRNDELYDELKEKFEASSNIKFYEFINLQEELKNIDIMISKPGGALVSECIATDTPMIVPSFVPGQEEGNKILLEKSETGIYENEPEKILFYLKYLNRNKFLSNFKEVKNPKSCEIILNKLL